MELNLAERNLDRAIALAANGRIFPDQVVETATKFNDYMKDNSVKSVRPDITPN